MSARAQPGFGPVSEPVACIGRGGCSYLRTLARLELLAGFDRTARLYERAAALCRKEGCWAAAQQEEAAASAAAAGSAPIPFVACPTPTSPDGIVRPPGIAEAIPFDRSALVDMVSDAAGNYLERRALKLESLADRTDSLGYIFNYWRQLRSGTDCTLANIDTVHLERAGIIGKMHVVNVSSSDPQDFEFDVVGYALPMGNQEKPSALPVPILAETAMRDYNTVRLADAPRLHRVRSRLAGVNYHYTRLMLPFLDVRCRVTRLLVAVRQEPGDGLKVDASK
jgi:hypothetical protein